MQHGPFKSRKDTFVCRLAEMYVYNTGNILFRDIADFREKKMLKPPPQKKKNPHTHTQIKNPHKIRGGFFVPENSKFDF